MPGRGAAAPPPPRSHFQVPAGPCVLVTVPSGLERPSTCPGPKAAHGTRAFHRVLGPEKPAPGAGGEAGPTGKGKCS